MSKSILIIEDDNMILVSLKEALELNGYQIYTSKSVKEAKEIFGSFKISLINFLIRKW